MNAQQAYERILPHVMNLPIIDTHEHLPAKEERRDQNGDLFIEFMRHYFNRDLISAGMNSKDMERVMNKEGTVMERWKLLEPHWQASRFTGYARALALAARDIYDVPHIAADTIETLYARFEEGMKPGHYELVLKEKSNIVISLLDSDPNCDKRYFRSVFRLEQFLFPFSADAIQEASGGQVPRTFPDWLDLCTHAVDREVSNGCVAFKIGMAYFRPLSVGPATYQEAEACFQKFSDTLHYPDWQGKPITRTRAYEDYMLHHVIRRVTHHNLPVQIHTGLQEGNGNMLPNADPLKLNNLFLEYPGTRFVLMHIGYPWHIQMTALAKNFPNVFLDMCWSHIISPNASVQALNEWLDAVPMNKICAFGGDYALIDGVYGHQLMARENIARSLADKMALGVMNENDAQEVARRLFLDNPYAIFGLKRHGVELPG